MSQPGHPLSDLESIITTRFTGFPAADHNVRNFLDNCTSQREVYARYAAFFTVLFQQLLTRLQTIDSDWRKYSVETNTKVSTAFKFRFLMTQNQTYGEPNEYRRTFYQQVCQKAEKVSNGIYTVIRYLYCIPCSYHLN